MKDNKKLVRRAQRFALEIPIRYRETGAAGWHEGSTVNISASGVLFRAERNLPLRTTVEMVLTLPPALPGGSSGKISSLGTMVRAVPMTDAGKGVFLGASIRTYRFVRHRRVQPGGDGSDSAGMQESWL